MKIQIVYGDRAPKIEPEPERNPVTPTPITVVPATPAPPAGNPLFDAAYWAHQPPAVQALKNIADPSARQAAALQLATQGYTIDVPIMIWLWEPSLVMQMRQADGYTWLPSALMPPIQVAPGIVQQGFITYDPANPPAGAIIVSTNIADYPPFTPPAPIPAPAAAPTSLVGAEEGLGSNYYQAFPAAIAQLTDGEVYTADPRGQFTFHKSENPFAPNGTVAWFTMNPPAAAAAA